MMDHMEGKGGNFPKAQEEVCIGEESAKKTGITIAI